MKIISVCGARPNFMKIAAIARNFAARPEIKHYLVHTGQHYDEAMDRWFFDDLAIPRPDINLEVGSHSHALQTARIMERFEPVVLRERPDAVLVVGDVNSTIACALVAAKLLVPIVHVEAGLRSFDRAMPEEINRVLTDALSDLLFVTEESGVANLRAEGVSPDRIRFVGNVMIDTLRAHRDKAAQSDVLNRLRLKSKGYSVLTLHRPSNVDDAGAFARLLGALETISRSKPVVFPMHPRTRASITRAGLMERVEAAKGLTITEPLGYLDFLKLMAESALVLTDSGGIQEETTVLGVPCLTLRENTERPATVTHGTNRLVGSDPAKIISAYQECLSSTPRGTIPDLWDGRAAERITDAMLAWFKSRGFASA